MREEQAGCCSILQRNCPPIHKTYWINAAGEVFLFRRRPYMRCFRRFIIFSLVIKIVFMTRDDRLRFVF